MWSERAGSQENRLTTATIGAPEVRELVTADITAATIGALEVLVDGGGLPRARSGVGR
jgi:hypothetical protein